MRKELVLIDNAEIIVSDWEIHLKRSLALSEASQETYSRGVDRFLAYLRANKLQASPTTIEMWKGELAEQGYRTNAINTWLSSIRNFFAWAVDGGMLAESPAEGIRNAKRRGANTSHLRDRLEDEEVIAVLNLPDPETEAGKRDQAILALKAYTGIRDVELYRLDFDDLVQVKGKPVLRIRGKGHQESDRIAVVYHPAAREAMHDWVEARGRRAGPLFTSLSNRSRGKRLSLKAIRWLAKRYLRMAGIDEPRKTSHSFRHSAITKVAEQNILSAQVMAGHADTKTTLIYVHEADRLKNPGEKYIDYE